MKRPWIVTLENSGFGIVRALGLCAAVAALVVLSWRIGLPTAAGLLESQLPTPPSAPPAATETAMPTDAPAAAGGTVTATAALPAVPTATLPVSSTVTTAPARLPPLAPAAASPVPSESTAVLPPSVTSEAPAGTETPLPQQPSAPASTAAPAAGEQRYPAEEVGLDYDWALLFDSLALGLSYLWLACGVVLLLCVPAAYLVLRSASKRRRQSETDSRDE